MNRRAHGEHGGLRMLGEGEAFRRALEAEPTERLAEHVVRLLERLPADRECAAASSFPMPTRCEPWPGNTNAIIGSSPL